MFGISPEVILPIVVIYLFAGFSKGIVGLGLPTIGISLATIFVGLDTAIAIATLPVILTNIYQAVIGGHFLHVLRRTWLFMLIAAIATGLATGLFVLVDPNTLTIFLGTILIVYAMLSLRAISLPPPGRHDVWISPILGALTGLVTGITGSAVVPGVMYLQSLNLPRDTFVQSLGLLFSLTYIGLVIGLGHHDILTLNIASASAFVIIPALIGMTFGMRIRRRIPEEKFRRVFLIVILIFGIYLFFKSLMHIL
ncbi:MAG: sulfite exporter TauE/SafE family protein [Alphaproteobacteria bacterium]|nr:sulfite exporter TauE/SafE family protein [Alphaproteobacteria bacterium]